jgi:hypothetical protein
VFSSLSTASRRPTDQTVSLLPAGSIIENLEALCPPSSLWEAVAQGIESQSRQADAVLTRLESNERLLEDHAYDTTSVVNALLPSIQALRSDSVDGLLQRILPRLDDLKSSIVTRQDVAEELRRVFVEHGYLLGTRASVECILSTVTEAIASSAVTLPPAPGIDMDDLLRRLIEALPVPAPVDLSDLSAAIQDLKVNFGQLPAAQDDLIARMSDSLRKELATSRKHESVPNSAESFLSDQLRRSEAERIKLSSEVQALQESAAEHRLLQRAAEADKNALAAVTGQVSLLEASQAFAVEQERTAATELASKDKEIGALQAQVSVTTAFFPTRHSRLTFGLSRSLSWSTTSSLRSTRPPRLGTPATFSNRPSCNSSSRSRRLLNEAAQARSATGIW